MRRPCHYCGTNVGDTQDHIVARYWYNPRHVPQNVAEANKVPCCSHCNGLKGHFRSECECNLCEIAWTLMAPYILPRKKSDIPVATMIGLAEKQ